MVKNSKKCDTNRLKRVISSSTERNKTVSTTGPTLRPTESGLRKPQAEVKVKYASLLPQMLELQAELIPFSTSCDMIGIGTEEYAHWVNRFPAIKQELKRARASALIELQRKVARGEQGWQALMRIAESADPDNFLRNSSGRPMNTASPYSAAMRGRKVKR